MPRRPRRAREVELGDGRTCSMRMALWLEGRHLRADELDELDEQLLLHFGSTAARLGRALRGLFHRGAGCTIEWDL